MIPALGATRHRVRGHHAAPAAILASGWARPLCVPRRLAQVMRRLSKRASRMTATSDGSTFAPRELFRYARVRPPRVLDLASRARALPEARGLIEGDAETVARLADELAASPRLVRRIADLAFDYRALLRTKDVPGERLPMRADIRDVAAFRKTIADSAEVRRSDRERVLLSLLVARARGETSETAALSRLLAFLEVFPDLPARTAPQAYPAAVVARTSFRAPAIERSRPHDLAPAAEDRRRNDLRRLADLLEKLADAQHARVSEARRRMDQGRAKLMQGPPEVSSKTSPRRAAAKGRSGAGTAEAAQRAERRAALSREHRRKREELAALKEEVAAASAVTGVAALLDTAPAALARHLPGHSDKEVAALQKEARQLMGTYGLKPGGFCETYDAAVGKLDRIATPPSVQLPAACFAEHPDLAFASTVRILGTGRLVRVDEEFLSYAPGEISYIENVLAGEVRKRKVRTERSFETVSETVAEDVSELSTRADSRSTQELKSEIESEIATRFTSDVSAAFNASGGGTIGVVDVEGGAAVNAGLGVGVESTLSSSDSSELSQDILKSAIERTRRTTVERRLTRSFTLSRTLDHHEIDNRGDDARHRNGVYCFLDKRVLIRETVYGLRVFLLANVAVPGKNLLCERMARLALGQLDTGTRPVFDIAPDDIQPATYKSLVARYGASNVEPPPAPSRTLSRTYKTDTTNANVEQAEFKPEKIAQLLVPYFRNYKRFLIAENVPLPDGYAVHTVAVTVNHGSNGVSIPAHLPFSIAGASMMMMPQIAAGAAYGGLLLPYSLWYVAYLASPLLHYNADSSNVTVSVGNESLDSPYYFFQPDFLIREIFGFFGNFSVAGPALLQRIEEAANQLVQELVANASQVPQQVADIINEKVADLVTRLRNVLNAVVGVIDLNPFDNAVGDVVTSINALAASAIDLTTLQQTMDALFAPLQAFVDTAFQLLDEGLQEAMSDLFGFLADMFDNSQDLLFLGAAGLKGELPVSLNTIAIKPGVTVNLTACLRRTEEAMDTWRLDTFGRLYQGYLQQLAEFEARSYAAGRGGAAVSPGTQRREEHRALKELVLHALNNLHGAEGNAYTLERMNLFENAIDWNNMNYRLFNYGPSGDEVLLEKLGAFAGGDERRRAFLTALWAQVLVPLQPHEHLEGQVARYLTTGAFDFDGDLGDEELTALYTDLVLERALVAETPESSSREEVLPTDLVVIVTDDLASQLPVSSSAAT